MAASLCLHAHVDTELVDPHDLALEECEERATLINAINAVDAPQNFPISGSHEQGHLKYGWDNRGLDQLVHVHDEHARLVGGSQIELGYWDNTSTAFVELDVHPDHRGRGVEDCLLEATYDVMRANDRNLIIASAWRDSPLAGFLVSHGFEIASHAAQRRLLMSELDWTTLDQLHAMSLEKSAAYDIVELPQPAPADMIADMLDLHRAINDAPLDDLQIEDEEWSTERVRGYEQAMTSRGIRLIRLVAVRREDGEFGGHTVMAIEDERPTLGFQEDTAVVVSHRGNRLGFRLKIEMLQLLRDREPQIEPVDTWNAESNGPMLAVNDAIGCQVVGRAIEVQRTLG
jgi:GNAT superfamily N-acetyltransferase